MKACTVDPAGAGPEPAAHTHFTDTRGQNGAHEATKVDNVVVLEEEKKHCTLVHNITITSHHSIVLIMAIVNAAGTFLVIDVGGFGSCSDGGLFQDFIFQIVENEQT